MGEVYRARDTRLNRNVAIKIRWQISAEGGCYTPRWRRDGKEMFYYRSDNRMMSVDVNAEATTFRVGASRVLFETRAYGIFSRYDITPDGQRFLIPYEAGEPSATITLVTNWADDRKE
jgi:eukaryotic-like serine/threonine-protein kinase